MIFPVHRRQLAIVIAIGLPVLPGTAQETEPPTTAEDVILSTTTPLGEASIVLPAGTAVTVPLGEEEEVTLREGPFSTVIKRDQLAFPSPSPTPEPASADSSPVPPDEAASTPAVSWTAAEPASSAMAWPEDWRTPVLAGAAILFGAYSVFTTSALVRRRRRRDDDD